VLALNAYHDEWVDLGPSVRLVEDCSNDNRGYAYSVFQLDGLGGRETIIAFRGTEGKNPLNQDWLFGNWGRAQQPRAVATARRIVSQPNTGQLTYVGHSLGGGLAIEASYNVIKEPLKVYAFNNSPRFRRTVEGPRAIQRYSIVEIGDALYVGRGPMPNARQQYNSLNCTRGFAPFRDHKMLRLASCLTRIAAESNIPNAQRLLHSNPSRQLQLRSDPRNRPTAPCYHHLDGTTP
jgi:hypothetical protein